MSDSFAGNSSQRIEVTLFCIDHGPMMAQSLASRREMNSICDDDNLPYHPGLPCESTGPSSPCLVEAIQSVRQYYEEMAFWNVPEKQEDIVEQWIGLVCFNLDQQQAAAPCCGLIHSLSRPTASRCAQLELWSSLPSQALSQTLQHEATVLKHGGSVTALLETIIQLLEECTNGQRSMNHNGPLDNYELSLRVIILTHSQTHLELCTVDSNLVERIGEFGVIWDTWFVNGKPSLENPWMILAEQITEATKARKQDSNEAKGDSEAELLASLSDLRPTLLSQTKNTPMQDTPLPSLSSTIELAKTSSRGNGDAARPLKQLHYPMTRAHGGDHYWKQVTIMLPQSSTAGSQQISQTSVLARAVLSRPIRSQESMMRSLPRVISLAKQSLPSTRQETASAVVPPPEYSLHVAGSSFPLSPSEVLLLQEAGRPKPFDIPTVHLHQAFSQESPVLPHNTTLHPSTRHTSLIIDSFVNSSELSPALFRVVGLPLFLSPHPRHTRLLVRLLNASVPVESLLDTTCASLESSERKEVAGYSTRRLWTMNTLNAFRHTALASCALLHSLYNQMKQQHVIAFGHLIQTSSTNIAPDHRQSVFSLCNLRPIALLCSAKGGFHVICLARPDEIRQPPLYQRLSREHSLTTLSQQDPQFDWLIGEAEVVVSKLTLPLSTESLMQLWSSPFRQNRLAIARAAVYSNSDSPETMKDVTLPDVSGMERCAGQELQKWKNSLDQYTS